MKKFYNVKKDHKHNFRISGELLSKLPGDKYSDKLAGIVMSLPKNQTEKLISNDTLYEEYGKKEDKRLISVRFTEDTSNEIDRLAKKYDITHTKVVVILATASTYSENEIKKLIKQMG